MATLTQQNISPALNQLRRKHDALKEIIANFGKQQEERANEITSRRYAPGVMGDPALYNKAVADRRQEFATRRESLKEGVLEELNALKSEADRLKMVADREIYAAMGRPAPKDTSEELLREMREGRAWDRIKGYLDTKSRDDLVPEARKVVRENLLQGDEDAVEALRRELPVYLKTRGEVPDHATLIITEEYGKHNPNVAVSQAAKAELEAGMYNLQFAITHTREAVKADKPGVTIALWEKGKTEDLAIPQVRI